MKFNSTSLLAGTLLVACLMPLGSQAENTNSVIKPQLKSTNNLIMPDNMQIYETKEYGTTKKAVKNATVKSLPTNNDFQGSPGCYLQCVSKNAEYSIFTKGTNEYVKGQMRVKGIYADGHCIPAGFDDKSIQDDKDLQSLCEKNFPKQCVNNSCGINSETADWIDM